MFLFIVLTLFSSLGHANTGKPIIHYSSWNLDSYPDSQQIQTWQEQLASGDAMVMYGISQRLYRLPREPWPEPVRAILYDIIQNYYIGEKRRTWQIPTTVDKCGEHYGEMMEMASWQEDARFAPFLAESLGSGQLAARGLIKIGEPAFDFIMPVLKRDGWSSQWEAILTVTWMMERDSPFLRAGEKRERLKKELYRIARPQDIGAQIKAIHALRHFPDTDVIRLLKYIGKEEQVRNHAPFPKKVRAEALNSLSHIIAKASKD